MERRTSHDQDNLSLNAIEITWNLPHWNHCRGSKNRWSVEWWENWRGICLMNQAHLWLLLWPWKGFHLDTENDSSESSAFSFIDARIIGLRNYESQPFFTAHKSGFQFSFVRYLAWSSHQLRSSLMQFYFLKRVSASKFLMEPKLGSKDLIILVYYVNGTNWQSVFSVVWIWISF